ncbi:MAG: filamentous hemagglutinin N-terminal domain-containing protein, partial [Candidatus Ratteibacteria bacterium]
MIGRNFGKSFKLVGKIFMLVASGYLLFPVQALPLPTGADVVSGQSSITTNGTQMTITQTTEKSIINWQGYSIDLNEIVKYIQPSANSISLNRVVGIDPSIILGQLIANGRVWIINPNGILFGKDSVINVSGLLATTLNIKDTDFIEGKYQFTQNQNSPLSSIINKGQIIINDNGYAILVAPLVSNEGLILANLGKVVIAGAENFVVNFDGQNLINFTISKTNQTPGTVLIPSSQITNIIREVVNTPQIIEAGSIIEENGNTYLVGASGTVINTGTIKADGAENQNAGSIILNSTQATIVARGSLISASGIGENSNGGEIRVLSDMSSGFTGVGYGATLQAKGGTSGNGGFIEISGAKFQTWGNIDVSAENGNTGTFLLDPVDIIIRDSANHTQDYNGAGGVNPFPDYGGLGLAFTTLDNDFNGNLISNEVASGYLTTLNGTIILQAQRDIIIDQITANPLTFTNDNLVLQAGRHITFSNAGAFTINTQGGYIILEADSPHAPTPGPGDPVDGRAPADGIGTIDFGQVTLQTGGGNITLIAADFNIPATATINAGGGNVSIALSVDGAALDLGSVAGAQLTDAEIDRITTSGTVTIGRAQTAGDNGQGLNAKTLTSGTITIDDLTPANFSNLTIVGNTIGDGTNDTGVTVSNLTLNTSGSIGTGADPLNINVDTLTASTNNSDITITEDNGLALNLVDAGRGNVSINLHLGAITDNNGTNLNIRGTNLILSAETGIGSGDALETQVTNLTARVTSGAATGNIEIENTGDLTLGNLAGWGEAVRNFGSGDIIITVN